MACDNRIINYIQADQVKGSSNPLIKFLNYKQLPYAEDEKFVLAFKPRVTKAGKKMASMTLANSSRDLESVVIFPSSFAKAYMSIKEGNAYKFSLSQAKDGTTVLEDINVR